MIHSIQNYLTMKKQFFLPKLLMGIIALVGALFPSSCEKDGQDVIPTDPVITDVGVPSGAPISATIGSSGGTLTSSDRKLTVSIPPGALSANTLISIQPISNEGPQALGTAYRIGPESVKFNQPVKLIFHYDDQLLGGTPDDFLWIITQDDDRSWNALLKSAIDKSTKTVTVSTDHFSDWALGKFISLSLSPSSKTLKRGDSVKLQVSGFARDTHSGNDELAPLVPLSATEGDVLTALTPIAAAEARWIDFRVKGWTLNGASAPVSGSSGSLTPSALSATYKAPNSRPSVNPVAVSVSLETSDKQGKKSSYLLNSKISVVHSDMYLLLTIDGNTYEYYQYGYNGSVPPDAENVSIANCGLTDNILSLAGAHVENGSNLVSSFTLSVKNPAKGTRQLNCLFANGEDEASFTWGAAQNQYTNFRYVRTKTAGGNCDVQDLCANVTVTFIEYENELMGRVAGYFSGVLYEDRPGFSDECKSPIAHTIEGEFWLTRAN